MGIQAPGMGIHGTEAQALGMDTAISTTIITDFLSGSSRIGIQDGDIMTTDTPIIRIMDTTIPIIITPTAATIRATTGRQAFRH